VRPKWNNLFWYEQGGDAGKPQLENNTTKGLLKTLQESDPSVTESFLAAFLDEPPELDGTPPVYNTQVGLGEIPCVDRKLHLVGLSYEGDNVAREAPPRDGNGRVDGVITFDRGGVSETVVIEVKTGRDRLQERQMATYRGALGIEPENCYGLSWPAVWEVIDTAGDASDSDLEQLLLTEFTEYLELMGMVPFKGFDREELQKPTSAEYKRSLMRGVNLSSTGTFARALHDACGEYGFGDFVATSNQDSSQLHLVEERYHEGTTPIRNANHYTVGFWNERLNVQLNARRRILSTITQWGSSEPKERFVKVLTEALEAAAETSLTNEQNPLVFVRYHGNIPQEHDNPYRPSTFYLDQFTYSLGMTDRQGLRCRIEQLARTVREAEDADIVSSPAFVVEKEIPYTSPFVADDRLPEHVLEFFETLQPVYELFEG
jgi:hypothetical protein